MDMSMTRGPCAVGTPTAMGLVPKTASEEPCGATYSGHCESTMPIRPSLASWRAQYLQRGYEQGSGLRAAFAAQQPPLFGFKTAHDCLRSSLGLLKSSNSTARPGIQGCRSF